MVVLNQTERTIFLLNEEHGGYDRGFRGSDSSGTKVLFQEGIQLHLLQQRQGVDLRRLRLCSGDQLNCVILFAVLWQYIKVLLGKHGSELHNIGGQRSGSGLCFRAVSGSFRKALGCRGRGSEVNLVRLWEEACEEQSVSELPTRVVRLWGLFLWL